MSPLTQPIRNLDADPCFERFDPGIFPAYVALPLPGCPATRRRTPGLSLLRNSTPAFSRTVATLQSVSVLATTGPSRFSIFWSVPSATFAFRHSSLCVQPRRDRAARVCLPVIVVKSRRYHGPVVKPKKLSNLH